MKHEEVIEIHAKKEVDDENSESMMMRTQKRNSFNYRFVITISITAFASKVTIETRTRAL